jgi:hypothetical protein
LGCYSGCISHNHSPFLRNTLDFLINPAIFVSTVHIRIAPEIVALHVSGTAKSNPHSGLRYFVRRGVKETDGEIRHGMNCIGASRKDQRSERDVNGEKERLLVRGDVLERIPANARP